MTYQEIQSEILRLSSNEMIKLKQLISSISQPYPGIEKNPSVAGGSACILNTRIPIWTLEGLRRQGVSEAQLLLDFPTLKAIDLVNAWNYVEDNLDEISKIIVENE